ncbi:MAG: hypothetical protein ACPGTU_13350, partial [Myxococcota bacterium]
WYLGNWNTKIDPVWSFSVDSLDGVTAGDSLRIFGGDYLGIEWLDGGTATVAEDGSIQSDEGSGIPFLSTLLLVKG